MLFKFAKISPLKLKSNIFLKIKIFFHFTIKYPQHLILLLAK